MWSFHWHLLWANRSHVLKVSLMIIVSIVTAILLLKDSSVRYEQLLVGHQATVRANRDIADVTKTITEDTPKEMREAIEHLERFARATIQWSESFEKRSLPLYLKHAISANEEGIDVWKDNPNHTNYPQYLSRTYHISFDDAITFINHECLKEIHRLRYYQSLQDEVEFDEVLLESPFNWLGHSDFVSYTGLLLFLAPVLLFGGVLLDERGAKAFLERLPLSSQRYIFGKSVVLWSGVFVLQVGCLVAMYAIQVMGHNVERWDVPYVFFESSGEWSETVLSLSWKVAVYMALLDAFLLGLAILFNIVLRSQLLTQIGLLVIVGWEALEVMIGRHLWASSWNPLYYFDMIPAWNGNKALLYHDEAFGFTAGIVSIVIAIGIVVGLIQGALMLWKWRKGGEHELIPL